MANKDENEGGSGGVFISPNPIHSRAMIDVDGNEIKRWSGMRGTPKEIIEPLEEHFIPDPAVIAKLSARPAQAPGRPKDLDIPPAEQAQHGPEDPLPPQGGEPGPAEGPKPSSPIGEMVKQQLANQIQEEILYAMKEIDMAALVRDAIKKAFKPE